MALQAIHDGVKLHHAVEVQLPGDQAQSFISVETEIFSVAYSVAF